MFVEDPNRVPCKSLKQTCIDELMGLKTDRFGPPPKWPVASRLASVVSARERGPGRHRRNERTALLARRCAPTVPCTTCRQYEKLLCSTRGVPTCVSEYPCARRHSGGRREWGKGCRLFGPSTGSALSRSGSQKRWPARIAPCVVFRASRGLAAWSKEMTGQLQTSKCNCTTALMATIGASVAVLWPRLSCMCECRCVRSTTDDVKRLADRSVVVIGVQRQT